MDLLKVDYDKCIKCGICVEACPSCILSMGELGPECNFDRGCMSCGHCVAICPTAAMDNKYVPLEEQLPLPMPVLDAETAYNFCGCVDQFVCLNRIHQLSQMYVNCLKYAAMRQQQVIHRECII